MSKLREVTGGTKTKMYCQGTMCRRCVLAALRTVKLGQIKSENQAKPLTYSEGGKKVVCRTNLEQMFKSTTPTDLDTQPTTTQQGLMCAQCECQLFLIPLVAGSESHLFRRMNSETHKCVYCNQMDINMECFAWAKLADIHLANGAAYGNGKEAQRI